MGDDKAWEGQGYWADQPSSNSELLADWRCCDLSRDHCCKKAFEQFHTHIWHSGWVHSSVHSEVSEQDFRHLSCPFWHRSDKLSPVRGRRVDDLLWMSHQPDVSSRGQEVADFSLWPTRTVTLRDFCIRYNNQSFCKGVQQLRTSLRCPQGHAHWQSLPVRNLWGRWGHNKPEGRIWEVDEQFCLNTGSSPWLSPLQQCDLAPYTKCLNWFNEGYILSQFTRLSNSGTEV